MATNEQLIERWQNVARVLVAMPPHERRKHFDMTTFGVQTACGTIACAAGHCGLDPWFRANGLKLDLDSLRSERGFATFNDGRFPDSALTDYFGEVGVESIFQNSDRRPVSKVIREVKAHIKRLRSEPQPSA